MKIRCFWVLGLALLVPSSASAGNWVATQWNGFCAQYRVNRDWPEQYLDHDRAAARAPFAAMVANGWRSQNTISNYHFDDATGDLNDTGKLKVQSILWATPPQYRSLYVLQAGSPEMTGYRVRSVQQYSQAIMQNEVPPPVMTTNREPFGASGETVDGVIKTAGENRPLPILPPVQRPTDQ
jgi:hypothetical protein